MSTKKIIREKQLSVSQEQFPFLREGNNEDFENRRSIYLKIAEFVASFQIDPNEIKVTLRRQLGLISSLSFPFFQK